MPYIEEWQADMRLSVDGKPYGGPWATYTGGRLQASDSKTRAGAMGSEVALSGPSSRDDVTMTIQLTDADMAWAKELEHKVTTGGVAKASIQYLQRNKSLVDGGAFIRTGVMKSVELPAGQFDSGTVGMLTAVIACDEVAG